ncbi:hypothetical protein LG299_11330 [Microbacterium lacus]|uniref:TolB family protein n=1 Tax=Microbacterium lacus TaxID=415217 RepID=UPI0038510649
MSVNPSELSARERGEMRDLVLAGAQRIRPVSSHRAQFVAIGLTLLVVGGVAGGILTATLRDDGTPAPIGTVDPDPAPTSPSLPGASGWVAYSSGFNEGDIYVVKEGSAPHRVLGADDAADDLDEVCPAFSPDGTRLASGQAQLDDVTSPQPARQNAALVLSNITADAEIADSRVVPLDGLSIPPCPIWSPDGRWVAFGSPAQTQMVVPAPQVWIVDTATDEIRRLTDLAANDVEWAPDSAALYIADDEGVLVYSLAEDDFSTIDDTAGAMAIAASPDGLALSVELAVGELRTPESRVDLWRMAVDGSERSLLDEGYTYSRGIGPVWSPDGNRIVYQRTCSQDCADLPSDLRQDELGMVIVGSGDPLGDVGTQVVLPSTRSAESSEPRLWIPVTVTWAPDSTTLRFLGWELTAAGEMAAGSGLLAVAVDDPAASTILWETYEGIGAFGVFPQNDFQSWSR